MASEKIRKERSDAASVPTYAWVMLGLSAALIVFAVVMHIAQSVVQPVIVVAAVVAVVGTAIVLFNWNKSAVFRHVVRGVTIALPLVFVGIAVTLWAVALSLNSQADIGFNGLSSFAMSMSHWQLLNVLLLPVWIAAASFGGLFDRVLLHTMAVLNAGLVTFFVYVSAPQVLVPVLATESNLWQFVYVAASFVFAALTFVPALYNNPERRLVK